MSGLKKEAEMSILRIILDNEPSGFIPTTILGIVRAFVATYLGQALGWYRAGEGAGLVRCDRRAIKPVIRKPSLAETCCR